MRVRSTILRGIALGAAAVLFVALPASAHPYIRGGEAPVDSLATLTLDLAHGCGDETAGEGAPTTQVSLEVPEWMRIIDIPEPDSWTLEFETDDDGYIQVVTWDVEGEPTEPAPAFDMDVVVTSEAGEVGDRVHLSVFQACDDMSYRWVGTPDEPADDPAINLTLAAADPDSPAPDEEMIIEPEEEEPTEPEETEEPVAATDDEPADNDTAEPVAEDELDAGTEDEPEEIDDEPVTDAEPVEAAPAEEDDGGANVALIVIIALVVVAAVGGGLYLRNRNAGAEG